MSKIDGTKKPSLDDDENTFYYDTAGRCVFGKEQCVNYYMLKKYAPRTKQLFRVARDEAYFNLGGGRLVYFIADALDSGKPDLSSTRAFIFDGDSLILKANVWRTQPFSPDSDNLLVLLMDKDTVGIVGGKMVRNYDIIEEYYPGSEFFVEL